MNIQTAHVTSYTNTKIRTTVYCVGLENTKLQTLIMWNICELLGFTAVAALLPLELQEHCDGPWDVCAAVLRCLKHDRILKDKKQCQYRCFLKIKLKPSKFSFHNTPACEHQWGKNLQMPPTLRLLPLHRNGCQYHLEVNECK